MKDYSDYSKTIFSKGIVCWNTNNQNYCVVIDGARGTENDRSSLVLEANGDAGFMLHTPPNRALVPTGKVANLESLKRELEKHIL